MWHNIPIFSTDVKPDVKVTHPVREVVPARPAQLMAARLRPVDPIPNASLSKVLGSVSVLQISLMETLILDAQLDPEVNQHKSNLLPVENNLHCLKTS